MGQLEGGFSNGLGFALIENGHHDPKTGQPVSHGYLTDGKVPTVIESPLVENVQCFFAHTYEPSGPFGAKGIGEAALNPIAAAFANAIYNAIGVRFTELPITPEKILQALKEKEEQREHVLAT